MLPTACTHVPLDRDAVDTTGLITDETTVRAVTVANAAVVAAIDATKTQSQ